ncbi:hypothetical protein [Salinibius halmophilus]|uniref:hypothetical protein n=1 Tax=Salinibius halmophilus TaxID=1853216 RepID=UPI000E66293F|nr:hypothetical protein [Salinibius halmophilus]
MSLIVTHSKIESCRIESALGDDPAVLLASLMAGQTAITEQAERKTAKNTPEPTPVYAAPYVQGMHDKLERLDIMLGAWLSTERFAAQDNTVVYLLTDHPLAAEQLQQHGYTIALQTSSVDDFLQQAKPLSDQPDAQPNDKRQLWITLHSEFLDSERHNLRADLFHFNNQEGKICGEALVAIEFSWQQQAQRKVTRLTENSWQTLSRVQKVALAEHLVEHTAAHSESQPNSHWLTNFNQSRGAQNEQYRVVQRQQQMQVKQQQQNTENTANDVANVDNRTLPINAAETTSATQFTSLHSTFGELGSAALPLLLCLLNQSSTLAVPLPKFSGIIYQQQATRLLIEPIKES